MTFSDRVMKRASSANHGQPVVSWALQTPRAPSDADTVWPPPAQFGPLPRQALLRLLAAPAANNSGPCWRMQALARAGQRCRRFKLQSYLRYVRPHAVAEMGGVQVPRASRAVGTEMDSSAFWQRYYYGLTIEYLAPSTRPGVGGANFSTSLYHGTASPIS